MPVNFKKIRSLLGLRFSSTPASPGTEGKKGFFNNHWRFNKKAKGLIVFAIIAVMLVSVFGFLPKGNNTVPDTPQSTDVPVASPNDTAPPATSKPDTISQVSGFFGSLGQNLVTILTPPKPPGLIETAGAMNSSTWRQVAINAWLYFRPGTGVDVGTGLPWAGYGSPNITDWDLGVYVQACIDALKLGLIDTNGTWGFNARMDKVLTFLETRELNNYSYPYWFYQAPDGKPYYTVSDKATIPVNVVDIGRLFVALSNLRDLKGVDSSLAPRVNNFVTNNNGNGNRSDYHALVSSVKSDSLTTTSLYAYYIYSGFAAFWPNDLADAPSNILRNIQLAGTVNASGVLVPNAVITGDPLLCSIFELNNNDSRLLAIAKQVNLAQEAYYNATGTYRAFGEGPSQSTDWEWEWVVYGGQTWAVLNDNVQPINMPPMIYTKIALSYLALYNTTYNYNMSVYLERNIPEPSYGYAEGVDESGILLNGVGSNSNGLILDAALYTISRNS